MSREVFSFIFSYFLLEAVRKFAKTFGKMHGFKMKGMWAALHHTLLLLAFALLLLCFAFLCVLRSKKTLSRFPFRVKRGFDKERHLNQLKKDASGFERACMNSEIFLKT